MFRKLFKRIWVDDFTGGFVNLGIKSVDMNYLVDEDETVRLEVDLFNDAVLLGGKVAVTYAELEEIYAAARRRGNI